MLSACEKYPQVSVVLDDITAFDVSAMQILLAAVRKTTARVDIRLRENSDCVTHWLNIAGLQDAVPVQAASAASKAANSIQQSALSSVLLHGIQTRDICVVMKIRLKKKIGILKTTLYGRRADSSNSQWQSEESEERFFRGQTHSMCSRPRLAKRADPIEVAATLPVLDSLSKHLRESYRCHQQQDAIEYANFAARTWLSRCDRSRFKMRSHRAQVSSS
jgi:hypothetical protein